MLSDHKLLTFALHSTTNARPPRQQLQLSYIAEFTSDLRHVAGKSNVVADAMSQPAAAVTAPINQMVEYMAMAVDQATSEATPGTGPTEEGRVFEAIHGLAHSGIRASKQLITSRFNWSGCAADVAEWCRNQLSELQHGQGHCAGKTEVVQIPVQCTRCKVLTCPHGNCGPFPGVIER